MRVLIFGATGMVGQGVLRECLLDAGVTEVLSVGRSATGERHPKLGELKMPDLFDYAAVEQHLAGWDACFFCLGVSSVGMREEAYRHITYELTMAAATVLARLNPQMCFIYVSGMNTDSTERGPRMWARVKGATENAVMRLPFRATYMFRPGMIQPMHHVRSKTMLYRIVYALAMPLLAWMVRKHPKAATTSERMGRAMLVAVRHGAASPFIENADINAMGKLAGNP